MGQGRRAFQDGGGGAEAPDSRRVTGHVGTPSAGARASVAWGISGRVHPV